MEHGSSKPDGHCPINHSYNEEDIILTIDNTTLDSSADKKGNSRTGRVKGPTCHNHEMNNPLCSQPFDGRKLCTHLTAESYCGDTSSGIVGHGSHLAKNNGTEKMVNNRPITRRERVHVKCDLDAPPIYTHEDKY